MLTGLSTTVSETTLEIVSEVPLPEQIRRVPKVLLHDHLDGGLRPATIVQLAAETGYDRLPTTDPEKLATWFLEAADSGSLERYLETFAHTVGVMQTQPALSRVAAECRTWPRTVSSMPRCGSLPSCTSRVGCPWNKWCGPWRGLRAGTEAAKSAGYEIHVRTLLTAMRHAAWSQEIAELAIRHRDEGVVGFDIAGAEAGFLPTRHLDAFQFIKRENGHFTIHAGEGSGCPRSGVRRCSGAARTGSATGVRIIDDIRIADDGEVTLGRLAAYVRDKDPARDVPVVEHPDWRRCLDRRASDRPAAPAAVPSHGQH